MVLRMALAAFVVVLAAGCGGTETDGGADAAETSAASASLTTVASAVAGEGRTFIDIIRSEEAAAPNPVWTTEMTDAELIEMALNLCGLAAEQGVVQVLNRTEADLAADGWGSHADNSLLSTLYGAATVTVCPMPGG